MHRFAIYNEEKLIGWSNLESGDPPMGVAFGQFIPATTYIDVQPLITSGQRSKKEGLNLSARLPSGQEIQSTGGVRISDYSASAGPEGIEVSILGISHPQYDTLFPEQVAAYEKSVKGSA